MKKGAVIYGLVTAFTLLTFIIYDRYSHGVRSPYMTFLFAWPLALGVLPCIVLALAAKLPRPNRFVINLYNSGVAALTVSSLLKGIFEIAGTASPLQQGLFVFGIVLTASGVCTYYLLCVHSEFPRLIR